MSKSQIGVFSALSIGIGGMVGGGIFAVTGLTIELTRGAAPVAFLVAGIVALLTSYSYLKLTSTYPSQGGTVEFLNRGFGPGVITGSANILLCLSYVVLLAIYAYAFASYAQGLLPAGHDKVFWLHALITGVISLLALLNFFGARSVIRSENAFNFTKMALLAVFVVVGLATPMTWSRLEPANFVPPFEIVSGAMIIFLNYEGFELIANASPDISNPKVALPVAYLGGVLITIAFYVLITLAVVGHMDFAMVAEHSDSILSVAAGSFMGPVGFYMIIVAAMLATSSAINATLYGSGRLTYVIAKSGELPAPLEREIRGMPLEGMILFAVLSLLIANFLPLHAIASMGSAGFLIIFLAVNIANMRLARKTGSRIWVSGLAAISCTIALLALCWQVWESPATRNELWVIAAMIAMSFGIEEVYRTIANRGIHLGHRDPSKNPPG